jgi:hypothetical protein
MISVQVPDYESHAHHRGRCDKGFGVKLLVICLLLGCFGCRTQPAWKLPPQSIGFSDEEVFSRTWTNQDGRMMQALVSTVKKSKRFGDFLLVKTGDRQTGQAFFCEVYSIKRVPAQQRVDTSRADLPMRLMPEHNVNVLLGRTGLDSGSFIIGNVTMREEVGKIAFSIDQRANHQYYWKQSGNSPKRGEPWDGGVIHTLTLTRDYEPNWTAWTYSGPPQLATGDP